MPGLFERCEVGLDTLMLHGIARLVVPEEPLHHRNYSAILSTARRGTIVLFVKNVQIGVHLFVLTDEDTLILYTAQVRRLQRAWRGRFNRPRLLHLRETTGRSLVSMRRRIHR